MENNVKIGLGLICGSVFAGIATYFGWKYYKQSLANAGVTMSLQVNSAGYLEAVVSWTDGSQKTVQVATVQNNVITGHFFNSETTASDATNAYSSGNSAEATQDAATPSFRLATGTGSATLYVADVSSVPGYASGGTVYAWVEDGDSTSALIVNDATGTDFSAITTKFAASQPA